MAQPIAIFSPDTVNTSLFDVAVADAVDWLRGQPAESIDLLVTDPAYESLEKHRAVGTTTRLKHSNCLLYTSDAADE